MYSYQRRGPVACACACGGGGGGLRGFHKSLLRGSLLGASFRSGGVAETRSPTRRRDACRCLSHAIAKCLVHVVERDAFIFV